MAEKKFKAAFIAHVPDADSAKHRSTLRTSLYELTSVLVRDDDDAVKVCRDLLQKEGVKSFLLCPGFTHAAIARIGEAVGDGISINVARGDGPSNQIALNIMNEVGWFKRASE
jgi:hypothetical protein